MAEVCGTVTVVEREWEAPFDARVHCRVSPDSVDDDAFELDDMIREAFDFCERRLGRSFVKTTLRLTMDGFPSWELRLPRGPVRSVTSVEYYDASGVLQTMDAEDYHFDPDQGVLQPAPLGYWPACQAWRSGAVKVTYEAGPDPAISDPPPALKRAVKLLVGHWYMNREAVGEVGKSMEFSVDSLLASLWTGEY